MPEGMLHASNVLQEGRKENPENPGFLFCRTRVSYSVTHQGTKCVVQERRSYCTAGLCDAKANALHGLHLAIYHVIGMQKRWRQGEAVVEWHGM